MAKISVSLPDELKARMDAYAQAHPAMGTSDIVQAALDQFLSPAVPVEPPAPPTPPPPTPPAGGVDLAAREFVLSLAIEVDAMRSSMMAAGLWVPAPLPPPSWYPLRNPGEKWPPKLEMHREPGGKKKNPPK